MGKVLRQHQNVFPALAQRGQGDDVKGEAVEQIVAKLPLVGEGRQILVGGAHQPHIDLERLGTTDPLEFAIFDDPQQFLLHPGAGGGQLVEKQGAAVGPLKPPLVALGRAGEGARLVTEQLGFQQTLTQGGAVDGDKALIPARREIM